jgi:hypothetical protein
MVTVTLIVPKSALGPQDEIIKILCVLSSYTDADIMHTCICMGRALVAGETVWCSPLSVVRRQITGTPPLETYLHLRTSKP